MMDKEIADSAKGVLTVASLLVAPELLAARLLVGSGRAIKLVDGFYHAEGTVFKFSQKYYDYLWSTGRGAPFLQADEILRTATSITADPRGKAGFYRYANDFMEMIYNPTTREVWHMVPLR